MVGQTGGRERGRKEGESPGNGRDRTEKPGVCPARAGWATKVERRSSDLAFGEEKNKAKPHRRQRRRDTDSNRNLISRLSEGNHLTYYPSSDSDLPPMNDWCAHCPPHNWPGAVTEITMAISGVNGFEPRIRPSHWRERLEQAKTQEGALSRAHLAPAAAVRHSQESSDFNDGLNSISSPPRKLAQGKHWCFHAAVALPAQTAS